MTRTFNDINSNFRIKVYGYLNGSFVNSLVGCSGLIDMIGIHHFDKFVRKAFESSSDSVHFKMYRSIKVSFYVK